MALFFFQSRSVRVGVAVVVVVERGQAKSYLGLVKQLDRNADGRSHFDS